MHNEESSWRPFIITYVLVELVLERIMENPRLHPKKFLSGQRQRVQKDRETEMSVTQWFQSQAVDFYDKEIQKLVQR